MANEESFKNINKIKYVDLAEDLQLSLAAGLITPDDRKKLDSLTAEGGTSKLVNPLSFRLGSKDPISYDATKPVEIDINPETIGAASSDHNHDDTYSKLDHEHNYAGSDVPGGSATSAKKLDNEVTITISGAISGRGSTDGTKNVEIQTAVTHSHNYAGSDKPGGSATSAKKLETPININVSGSEVGGSPVPIDGTKDIDIELLPNHEHPEYSPIEHDHDDQYASLVHTHPYAGSEYPGGPADLAKSLYEPLKVKVTGSELGSVTFSGDEKEVQLNLTVNHGHDISELTGFENGIKNPTPITIKYDGVTKVIYDGSEAKEFNIKPATVQVASASLLPKVGDINTTYVILETQESVIFNADSGKYISVGLGKDSMKVIDGNLK